MSRAARGGGRRGGNTTANNQPALQRASAQSQAQGAYLGLGLRWRGGKASLAVSRKSGLKFNASGELDQVRVANLKPLNMTVTGSLTAEQGQLLADRLDAMLPILIETGLMETS